MVMSELRQCADSLSSRRSSFVESPEYPRTASPEVFAKASVAGSTHEAPEREVTGAWRSPMPTSMSHAQLAARPRGHSVPHNGMNGLDQHPQRVQRSASLAACREAAEPDDYGRAAAPLHRDHDAVQRMHDESPPPSPTTRRPPQGDFRKPRLSRQESAGLSPMMSPSDDFASARTDPRTQGLPQACVRARADLRRALQLVTSSSGQHLDPGSEPNDEDLAAALRYIVGRQPLGTNGRPERGESSRGGTPERDHDRQSTPVEQVHDISQFNENQMFI